MVVTIKEVAKQAGVSVSTVSLMLNGKQNISEEKYLRIQQVMKELKYRPSIIAQNLKKQKFHIVGVVLPSTEGYYSQILKGINDIMDTEKYDLIIKISGDNAKREEEYIENMIALGVSGIMLVPCNTKNIEKYKEWQETGVKLVFLERKIQNVDIGNVLFDNHKLIYQKTKQLLESYAPEEMALVTGYNKYTNERDCKEGYLDAVAEKYPGTDVSKLDVIETSFERKRMMLDMLKHHGSMDSPVKCYVVSSLRVAEILAEIQAIMMRDTVIYALGGDVWFSFRERENMGVKVIPRDAIKFGHQAAERMLDLVKSKSMVEVRDILVESKLSASKRDIRTMPKYSCKRPLKALLLQSNAMDILSKLSPSFEKQTDIKVDFDFLPFYELTNKLAGDAEALSEYDILWVDMPLVEMMSRQKKLFDMREMTERDDEDILARFPEGVLKCVLKGRRQIYGLPIQIEDSLLYYRNDAFSDPDLRRSFYNKYGFELHVPVSWPEFNIVAEFFDRRVRPESPFKYGTALSLTGHAFMEEFYVRQWAFNGSMFDKWRKLSIDSIENLRALKNLIVSYQHSPEESVSYFFDETFQELLKEEVPMIMGFPVHYLPFRQKGISEHIEHDISVTTIPGGHPILGGWVFGINAVSQMKDEAYQYIKWSLREDLAVTLDLLGGVQPTKETFDNSLLQNNLPSLKMMDADNFFNGMRESFRDNKGGLIDQSIIENSLKTEMMKAMLGEISPEEALKRAHKAAEELITV